MSPSRKFRRPPFPDSAADPLAAASLPSLVAQAKEKAAEDKFWPITMSADDEGQSSRILNWQA